MTTATDLAVTEPGAYDGMPDDVYHGDPVPAGSLSSTGARKLLPPSCPALFRWWADHGQEPKQEFDVGKAAHMLVLGAGPKLAEVKAKEWRTNAAKEQRAAAYAAGMVPLLTADYEMVHAMADALRRHPVAPVLFDAALGGRPEQSLFWVDTEFDCWRRARLDWLRDPGRGRLIIPDYKTAKSAAPAACSKSMADYGYHMQADWYRAAVAALGLADDPGFVFVSQEKAPPYLITVWQPDPDALDAARVMNRKALDTWQRCLAADRWPGYGDEVASLPLPSWEMYRYDAAWRRGDYEIGGTDD
jgi:hypothetical protein